MAEKKLLFLGTHQDKEHLPRLKSLVGTSVVYIVCEPVSTLIEVILYCRKREITGVICTSQVILSKLLHKESDRKQPSLDNYAGSLFTRDGIEFVFINPLEHFVTVPYGKFLAERFISKLTKPESWPDAIQFQWSILTPSNIDSIFSSYSGAFLIAVDIETYKENLAIRCIGYTAVFLTTDNTISTHSCILPLNSVWALAWMRKFNWELKAPKIFQGGKYDNAYLLRYNAPIYNWLYDTGTMFHCWYSELPKDLGFLGAFFVREILYWKDLADTSDLQQYYLYNCRDHWTTALVALFWFLESPEWAKENYKKEFPINYPCLLTEMIGLKRDFTRMGAAREKINAELEPKLVSLRKMVGFSINPGSYVHVGLLLKLLGCCDLPSTKEMYIEKARYRHPLNARILGLVLDIRGLRKLKTTYLRTADDITPNSKRGAKEFHGIILYVINPHGTDTGRNNSAEHHFWCGLQIHNIPRGATVKQTIIAFDSFRFAEADLKQAESRDTAYISGDENLIAAVEGTRDFHSVNASSFFGRAYETIFDDSTGKTKDKKLRDLSKRTNHGANYNMGDNVLVDTMGLERVEEARKLLGLPKSWRYNQVTHYLLERFHATYPKIKALYYEYVIATVRTTRMLVGATGWTRYCFGDINNKRNLNSLVAHCPQSLNAMVLNEAYMKVFYEIALPPRNIPAYKERAINFKLGPQIHDSILFQFREGHEWLATLVRECMEIPVTIKGCDGVTRTFTVPADIKAGVDGKGAIYWSDTEPE